MAYPTYSTRFINAYNSSFASYTVPDGFRAVVRDIEVYNGNTFALVNFTMQLEGAAHWFEWTDVDITQAMQHQWQGRVVVYEGEDFSFSCNAMVDVICSGYLLTLP